MSFEAVDAPAGIDLALVEPTAAVQTAERVPHGDVLDVALPDRCPGAGCTIVYFVIARSEQPLTAKKSVVVNVTATATSTGPTPRPDDVSLARSPVLDYAGDPTSRTAHAEGTISFDPRGDAGPAAHLRLHVPAALLDRDLAFPFRGILRVSSTGSPDWVATVEAGDGTSGGPDDEVDILRLCRRGFECSVPLTVDAQLAPRSGMTDPPAGASVLPVTLTWRVDARFEILKAGEALPDATPSLVEVAAPWPSAAGQ